MLEQLLLQSKARKGQKETEMMERLVMKDYAFIENFKEEWDVTENHQEKLLSTCSSSV